MPPSRNAQDVLDRMEGILNSPVSSGWLTGILCVATLIFGFSIGMVGRSWSDLQTNPTEETKRQFDAALGAVGTEATIAGGVVLFLNFMVTSRNLKQERDRAESDRKLNERKLTVERFSKAVEMLGDSKSIHIRLGGIYALEGIANDSDPDEPDADYLQVLEVLTAFVRNPVTTIRPDIESKDNQQLVAPPEPLQPSSTGSAVTDEKKDEEIPPLLADMQAVLTVLSKRKHAKRDSGKIRLNLRATDLRGANLKGAQLVRSNLKGAFLGGSNLFMANLKWANLEESNLKGAFLGGANLKESNLKGANLERVLFWFEGLSESKLAEAKEKAKLAIQSAKNWKEAHYDPEIRELLGLPLESVPSNEQSSADQSTYASNS